MRAKLPTAQQLVRQKDGDGYRLRDRMEEIRGELTQQEFADRCGVPLSTAQEWLGAGKVGVRSKKGVPSGKSLYGIAQGFGVTTDWILGVDGARKYPNQEREAAQLADDVREHVAREALKTADTTAQEEWIPYGETLLELLVDIVADDLQANADFWRERDQVAKDIGSLVASTDAELPKNLMARLQKAFPEPPKGKAIKWQPFTHTSKHGNWSLSGHALSFALIKGDPDV